MEYPTQLAAERSRPQCGNPPHGRKTRRRSRPPFAACPVAALRADAKNGSAAMTQFLLALLGAWLSFAVAEASEWSFMEHPALGDDEIGITFQEAREIATQRRMKACEIYEKHAWDAYLKQHPDFLEL